MRRRCWPVPGWAPEAFQSPFVQPGSLAGVQHLLGHEMSFLHVSSLRQKYREFLVFGFGPDWAQPHLPMTSAGRVWERSSVVLLFIICLMSSIGLAVFDLLVKDANK